MPLLIFNQSRMIERANFSYSPYGKAFKSQTKTFDDQGREHVEALQILKPAGQQKPKSI